jgi:WD40-like Beta Propeller Repeat
MQIDLISNNFQELKIASMYVQSNLSIFFTMLKYIFATILVVLLTSQTLAYNNTLPVASNLGGRSIATIQNQDAAHPTLSPDGQYLAYVDTEYKGRDKESKDSAIHVLNLTTKQSYQLLSRQGAARYRDTPSNGTYITLMQWLQADRLEASIRSFHTDGKTLTFNPLTRQLLQERENYDGDGGGDEERLQEEQKITSTFALQSSDLENVFTFTDNDQNLPNTWMASGALQNKPKNIWLLNLRDRSIKPLFDANDVLANSYIQNRTLSSDGSLAMILEPVNGDQSFLVICKDGKVQSRQALPTLEKDRKNHTILYSNGSKVIIQNQAYGFRGHNPLYVWHQGELTEQQEYSEIHAVHINRSGTRIAYCYWQNGQLDIAVKELFL